MVAERECKMRKIWLCGAAILIAAMVAGGIARHAAERRNCLCYIAEHSPGSSIPVDDRVRNEVSGQEITDETMKICTYHCKHGHTMLLQIIGNTDCTVRPFGGN